MRVDVEPVAEAERIVQKAHLRRRSAIAGGAVALTLLTGGIWASDPTAEGPTSGDSVSAPAMCSAGGRNAGIYVPCNQPRSRSDQTIEKIIGTTTTGCVVGFIFGLGGGIVPGCVGGLVGNIAW